MIKWSHFNFFEDRTPVAFIYGCANLTLLQRLAHWQGTGLVGRTMSSGRHNPTLQQEMHSIIATHYIL